MLMEEQMRRMERFLSLGTLASGLAPRDQEPADGAEHPRPAARGAAARADRRRRPVDELIGVLKTEVAGSTASSRASATSPASSA